MTGPEHYREAERLLAKAATAPGMSYSRDALDAAKAHAALAQVAATIDARGYGLDGVRREAEWSEVLS